jgi:chitodextrinase
MPTKANTATSPESTDTEAADAALAYDAWFRSEVEAGLREADDPNTVWYTQEQVEQESAKRRAEWQAEIARRRNSA